MKPLFLWWLLVVVQQPLALSTQLWRLVTVESSWITSTVQQTKQSLDTLKCAMRCASLGWCEAWCHDGALRCQLTNLVVSGSYQTNATTNVLTCYTNHSSLPEYAFHAAVTSTSVSGNIRIKKHLVDGIYDWDIDSCSCLYYLSSPWFLMDLGRPVNVSKVLLIAQPNTGAASSFRDFEVRVGASPQHTGNCASYKLLGTFPGTGTPSQRVVLKSPKPLLGQYVSIQMTSTDYFQICHLEIH
nr:uncharacterized protein LOC123750636 [Procambarus clarkii]